MVWSLVSIRSELIFELSTGKRRETDRETKLRNRNFDSPYLP
jgi:hypothetical protein